MAIYYNENGELQDFESWGKQLSVISVAGSINRSARNKSRGLGISLMIFALTAEMRTVPA